MTIRNSYQAYITVHILSPKVPSLALTPFVRGRRLSSGVRPLNCLKWMSFPLTPCAFLQSIFSRCNLSPGISRIPYWPSGLPHPPYISIPPHHRSQHALSTHKQNGILHPTLQGLFFRIPPLCLLSPCVWSSAPNSPLRTMRGVYLFRG